MNDTTYNGWTNYATWRINLEWFDGDYEMEYTSPEYLQEFVEDGIEAECDNETTISYALAFLNDVNWLEISEHINENNEEETE